MSWSVICWAQSLIGPATLTAINAVTDQLANTIATTGLVSLGDKLYAVYGIAASLTRAQLTSPAIRSFAPLEVDPVDVAASPGTPPALVDLFDDPGPTTIGDTLTFSITDSSAVAEVVTGAAWLGTGIDKAPDGPMFTTRATGTATLATTAWTTVALTFADTLKPGTYSVVGFRARSATGGIARIVFAGGAPIPGGANARPGVIATSGIGRLDAPRFRGRNAGLFGTFTDRTLPSVEMLGRAADTSETFDFDLVGPK